MDKKVYNKPTLKLEVFTPNEYIASCWYIKAGDCFNRIYQMTHNGKVQWGEAIYTHESHSKLPSEGQFKTEGESSVRAEEKSATNWYYYDVDKGSWNGNKDITESNGFHLITSYYEYDGHRFSSINESNAAS